MSQGYELTRARPSATDPDIGMTDVTRRRGDNPRGFHHPVRGAWPRPHLVRGKGPAGGTSSRRLTWLWEGLGEVDRVSVRIQDVGHALPPGHVVRRAENTATEGLDVLQQALHVPDVQVSDVDVEEYPLRGGDVGVPVGHHAELGVADLQAHVEGRAVLGHARDLHGAEQCFV